MRVLNDPALDGPTNMARDEALMLHVGRLESPATLRLYQWSTPTISLGYFQRSSDLAAMNERLTKLPVVRRLTGGGAILHDLELTYSVSIPNEHHLVSGRPKRLYELVHDALITSLDALGISAVRCGQTDESGPRRGPFFCFARRHEFDVLVGSDKIAGSAQRRTREAILQHGSIVFGNRFEEQPTANVSIPVDDPIGKLRSSFAVHLGAVMGEDIISGSWNDSELALADTLTQKYAGSEWIDRT